MCRNGGSCWWDAERFRKKRGGKKNVSGEAGGRNAGRYDVKCEILIGLSSIYYHLLSETFFRSSSEKLDRTAATPQMGVALCVPMIGITERVALIPCHFIRTI